MTSFKDNLWFVHRDSVWKLRSTFSLPKMDTVPPTPQINHIMIFNYMIVFPFAF